VEFVSPSLHNEVSRAPLGSSASLIPEIADVYAHFTALVALAKERFHGELGGKLLLFGQLDVQGAAIALAANIAGAAMLGVDSDLERLRQGIRHGFCDFLVNSLDEALRILKNEVRKKQPVSVCLEGDLATILTEAVDRGLQPDLLAVAEKSAAVETLIQRGAIALDQNPESKNQSQEITWTAESAGARWLPKVDALAAQVLPAGDERLRWLRLAPRYLGRTIGRRHYLRTTAEEAERFAALVAEAMISGAIATKITIERQGPQPHPRPR
jgi:urocanate hydratase